MIPLNKFWLRLRILIFFQKNFKVSLALMCKTHHIIRRDRSMPFCSVLEIYVHLTVITVVVMIK